MLPAATAEHYGWCSNITGIGASNCGFKSREIGGAGQFERERRYGVSDLGPLGSRLETIGASGFKLILNQ